MNCAVCGEKWFDFPGSEVYLLRHVVKKHFFRPRGTFVGLFPDPYSNNQQRRSFHYVLKCWCGWDAFAMLGNAVSYPEDFAAAEIASVLHLERAGGVEHHWLEWRLENLGLQLPPRLKFLHPTKVFTAEGGFK